MAFNRKTDETAIEQPLDLREQWRYLRIRWSNFGKLKRLRQNVNKKTDLKFVQSYHRMESKD